MEEKKADAAAPNPWGFRGLPRNHVYKFLLDLTNGMNWLVWFYASR